MRGDILDWCRRALHDEVMKWVVAAIFLKLPDHSKPLARDLLAAGMRERNPSCNRVFLEPVRRREQWPQIVDWMIEIAESGGNLEKGGVARAAYHLQGGKPMDETSRRRLQSWMHLEFLRNEDLVAQRSLMPALDFDPASVDVEVKPFIEQAIDKASNSDDKYIRHRLGVQLGTHTGPFMMLDTSGDRDAD
ncbi:MAG: hypothetical protein QNI99_16980 [Woeseiaceae bacterium]|nr:hypothetical protein [Woeseiaceae bacterium]